MRAIRTLSLLAVGAASWSACVYDWTWPSPAECSPAAPCPEDQYCVYADRACGNAEKGTCQAKPGQCHEGEGPFVCGCDDTVHQNECWAAQLGHDVAQALECAGKDPGAAALIPCGYVFCETGQFCRHRASTSECLKVPETCASVACGCPELCEGMMEDDCIVEPNGGLIVTCI